MLRGYEMIYDIDKSNLFKRGLLIALLVVLFDQSTKFLALHFFNLWETKTIIPGFLDFTLRYNLGAAFSLLAEQGGWQRWFFISLAIVISVVILFWLKNLSSKEKLEGLALSLILGGAIGNVIDRIIHGYVIDFILFYYQQWQYPAFNIADSAITMGVILFVLSLFKKKKSNRF